MDDTETHIFMKALEVNQTLKVLDFSDNIIGGQHEKLQGGIATGGEAIAKVRNVLGERVSFSHLILIDYVTSPFPFAPSGASL